MTIKELLIMIINNEELPKSFIHNGNKYYLNKNGEYISRIYQTSDNIGLCLDYKAIQNDKIILNILDDKEKEYLSQVIKPFRNKVRSIRKMYSSDNSYYIIIYTLDGDSSSLPRFHNKTMYKGMKKGKYYSLEELGL